MLFKEPDLFSVRSDPNASYEETEHYVCINSADRDISVYPQPQYYRIKLDTPLRNIKSVELIAATVPDKNNVRDEPYLVVKIDELPNIDFSGNNAAGDGFAIIQLKSPTKADGFVNAESSLMSRSVKTFKTPLASLAQLTITLATYSGAPFNFGNDAAGPAKALQNMLLFRVVTLDRNTAPLQTRMLH